MVSWSHLIANKCIICFNALFTRAYIHRRHSRASSSEGEAMFLKKREKKMNNNNSIQKIHDDGKIKSKNSFFECATYVLFSVSLLFFLVLFFMLSVSLFARCLSLSILFLFRLIYSFVSFFYLNILYILHFSLTHRHCQFKKKKKKKSAVQNSPYSAQKSGFVIRPDNVQ